MISLHVFMLGVLIASTLTGLATEAIKKILAEHDKSYYANTLAGVVSTILSIAIGVGYMLISNIDFSAQFIVCLIALVFISWLSAMVGYDKVIQAISQFKTAKPENDKTNPEERNVMTENQLRSNVVSVMKGWLGWSEANGKFKRIIDIYNDHKPLARDYKVKYTDAWCATAVSAAFIKAGLTDIGFTECSCNCMIALYKAKGRWEEKDSYVPKIGDIIMYDWQDNGVGDNVGSADHVGLVTAINGTKLTVIEGNKNDAVAYRSININGKYIRGYCLPDYASKADKAVETISTSTYSKEVFIRDVQKAFGITVDGLAGPETINSTITLSAVLNRKHEVIRAVQRRLAALGYTSVGKIDGIAGVKFTQAVKEFQKKNSCIVDGEITARGKTWKKLLGIV